MTKPNSKISTLLKLSTACFLLSLAIISPARAEENASTTEQNLPIIPEISNEIATTTPTTSTPAEDANLGQSVQLIEPVYITNQVNINYLDQNIFSGAVQTTSTWFYDDSGALFQSPTTTALGVLAEAGRQGNLILNIKNGWGSYYVSSIASTSAEGFDGWIYNVNMIDPDWTAMNDYLIKDRDQLNIFYSLWPWKVKSDIPTTTLGKNIIFTAYNYQEKNWLAGASTTLSINGQLYITDQNGTVKYLTTATGTISAFIYGTPEWPANSPTIKVEVLELTTGTSTPEQPPASPPSGGGSGPDNNLVSNEKINQTIANVLNYLRNKQNTSGEIADGGVTDWAIMSFAAKNIYADQIKNGDKTLLEYATSYQFTDASDLNLCASYPRHIMALLAAGTSSSDEQIQTLVSKIKSDCSKNDVYGLDGINDDVFGLIGLLAAGVNLNDQLVQIPLQNIIKDQQTDGSFTWGGFPGADITGATINALKYAESKGAAINPDIYINAKKYLKDNQLADGGWGWGTSDILTTSWVVMGINALKESQVDWENNQSKNPWQVLTSWNADNTDWFNTKHVVPALSGSSWPIILPPVVTQKLENNGNGTGGYSTNPLATSTSTLTTTSTLNLQNIIATSTAQIVTSTTPVVLGEKITQETPVVISTPATNKPYETKPITNNVTIQQFSNKQITEKQITEKKENQTLKKTNELINNLPLDTPTRRTAKKVAAVTGGSALVVGLYLGFRLLKNMV